MTGKTYIRMLAGKLWTDLNLRKKLSIAFVLISVPPLILATVITWHAYEATMRNSVFENNRNLAEQIANEVDRMFLEKIRILKVAAHTAEMKSMDPIRQAAVLKEIATHNPEVQLAVTANTSGRQIARWDGHQANPDITYNDRQYYHAVLANGNTAISDVLEARSTGVLGVVVAEPIISDEHTLVGVLILNIELEKLINRIAVTKSDGAGFAYIVNSSGEIIIDPDRGLIKNAINASVRPPVQAATSGRTGWVEYEETGVKKLAGYSYAPTPRWGIIAEKPLDKALTGVIHIKHLIILIVACTALFAALAGFFIARALAKPIADISAATNRLAAGELNIQLNVTARDELGRLATAFNNMTAQIMKRDEALRGSEEKYRTLVDNIHIGIYRVKESSNGSFIQVNPAMAMIFGYDSTEELMKIPMVNLYQNSDDRKKLIMEVKQKGFIKNVEASLRKKDGALIVGSFTTTVQYDNDGNIKWLDGIVEDITERKLAAEQLYLAHNQLESLVAQRTRELTIANEELRRVSLSDGLTAIANRRYFDEVLEREWEQAKREETSLALILLDLDFFKSYNDTYGHLAGDECLKQIAKILKMIMSSRPSALPARYGGEEFVIILPGAEGKSAASVGEAVRFGVEQLKIPHEKSAIHPYVTTSAGVAVCRPGGKTSSSEIIGAADQALYQAKQKGRNRVELVILG